VVVVVVRVRGEGEERGTRMRVWGAVRVVEVRLPDYCTPTNKRKAARDEREKRR
jgi:hypothetical protein